MDEGLTLDDVNLAIRNIEDTHTHIQNLETQKQELVTERGHLITKVRKLEADRFLERLHVHLGGLVMSRQLRDLKKQAEELTSQLQKRK